MIHNKRIWLSFSVVFSVLIFFLSGDKGIAENKKRSVHTFAEHLERIAKDNPGISIDEFIKKLPEEYRSSVELAVDGKYEDIIFHGKVVDQHGTPISNVKVNYGVGGGYLSGGGSGSVSTGDSGEFSIRNRGSTLTIYNLIHPSSKYLISAHDIGQSVLFGAYGNDLNGFKNPEKPFTFKMWRFSDLPSLSISEGFFSLVGDGREYILDLDSDNRMRIFPSDYDSGDFKLVFSANNPVGSNENVWSFRLDPINTNQISSSIDPYMNQAHTSGYSGDPLIFKNETEQDDYYRQGEFYLKSNSGYGALVFSFDARNVTAGESKGVFRYKFKFNRNMSTDLQSMEW